MKRNLILISLILGTSAFAKQGDEVFDPMATTQKSKAAQWQEKCNGANMEETDGNPAPCLAQAAILPDIKQTQGYVEHATENKVNTAARNTIVPVQITDNTTPDALLRPVLSAPAKTDEPGNDKNNGHQ